MLGDWGKVPGDLYVGRSLGAFMSLLPNWQSHNEKGGGCTPT